MRRHADGFGEIAPARPAGNLGFVVGEIKKTAAAETGIFARVGCEPLPEIEAFRGDRQFACVAVLLAAPTPVAARLLRADAALFYQHCFQTAPRQVIGRKDADNATADHDDIGGLRQVGGGVDEGKRRGHGNLQFCLDSMRLARICGTAISFTTAENSGPGTGIEIFCANSDLPA